MIEAIVLGAAVGAVVESGKRGLIKSRGNADELPPPVKAAMLVILIAIPAIHASTVGQYAITTLTTIGAFTVARWSVASVIVLWRRVLR